MIYINFNLPYKILRRLEMIRHKDISHKKTAFFGNAVNWHCFSGSFLFCICNEEFTYAPFCTSE